MNFHHFTIILTLSQTLTLTSSQTAPSQWDGQKGQKGAVGVKGFQGAPGVGGAVVSNITSIHYVNALSLPHNM